MKSFYKELWLDIPDRMEFINITKNVEDTVYESDIKDGFEGSVDEGNWIDNEMV